MPYASPSRPAVPASSVPRRVPSRRFTPFPGSSTERLAAWSRQIHEEVTEFFERLDGGGAFREDRWTRAGGGGGVSRVMENGQTWEKAGVNWSAVHGDIPAEMAQHLCAHGKTVDAVRFFATGVSVVVHPRSPLVPTVHLNVRCFVLEDEAGRQIDAWYGGGTDLTPTYPFPEDAVSFHTALRALCDRHDPT
jgi:coproporphyrinogen III oxidase